MENVELIEHDSNAALAELERGLRSGFPGNQCGAIVKVPILFEKYPFPIFINATLLKLSDVFRDGTNFLRQTILKVIEKSDRHVEKLISVDTIVKRIYGVCHSNDPIARSLSLRFLGCLSCVIGARKNVHHLVINSLDSRDSDELHAAIFAAQKLAEHSSEFCRGVFDKVSSMMLSIAVPVETKLLLIPIFRHMHTDAESIDKVFKFCKHELLAKFPDVSVIATTLQTLTYFVTAAQLHITDLISLLLDILATNTRVLVRSTAVYCLRKLAKCAPQMWLDKHLDSLCSRCDGQNGFSNAVRLKIIEVLTELCSSPCVNLCCADKLLVPTCRSLLMDNSEAVNINTVWLVVNLLKSSDDEALKTVLLDLAKESIMFLMPTVDFSAQCDADRKHLQLLLKATVTVAKVTPVASDALEMVNCLVLALRFCKEGSVLKLVAENIVAAFDVRPETYFATSQTLIKVLRELPATLLLEHMPLITAVLLYPAFEQSAEIGLNSGCSLLYNVLLPLIPSDETLSLWTVYKMVRIAMRNGHAELARSLMDLLSHNALSLPTRHWMSALSCLCEADICFLKVVDNNHFLSVVEKCAEHLHKASIDFKVAFAAQPKVWFTVEYTSIRLEIFLALKKLLTVFNTSPLILPPSVHQLPSTDRGVKLRRFAQLLEERANEFTRLSDKLKDLECRCFDADLHSLQHLSLLQIQLRLVVFGLCTAIGTKCPGLVLPDVKTSGCNQCHLFRLHWAETEIAKLPQNFGVLTFEAFDHVKAVVEAVFRQPWYYPRFMFQILQTTSLQLEIFPKPVGTDTAISILAEQQLALKVEGVVNCTTLLSRPFRSLCSVLVSVTVEENNDQKRTAFVLPPNEKGVAAPSTKQLRKTVAMRHDYFTAEFLLRIVQSSKLKINVDYIDATNQAIWMSGADNELKVTVAAASTRQRNTGFGQASFNIATLKNTALKPGSCSQSIVPMET